MLSNQQILRVITTLLKSHNSIRKIFTDGACYEFYKLLKIIEPSAEPWYDGYHVYTKIGDTFYDIEGEQMFSEMGERGLRRMTADDELKAEFWAVKQFNVDKNG